MCTALSLRAKKHYFGRNLDLDCSYGEEVCILPRRAPLRFRKTGERATHYALIGMATVVGGEPLFYDGANEYGLSMAGLNFPNNAYYPPLQEGKDNVTPFEFIPWILGQCKTVKEARVLLARINLVGIPFSEKLPLSPLHWIIADKKESIVVESMQDGLHIHDNPVGVLTNNPPFDEHLQNLKKYRDLRTDNGETVVPASAYCQGLGAVGLPGDYSSPSRFVRAAFHLTNSVCKTEEKGAVEQFFHLLASVEMVEGSCLTPSGRYDITTYSSCVNTDEGIYYYTTYGNRRIRCVAMRRVDLEGDTLFRYPLITEEEIPCQN